MKKCIILIAFCVFSANSIDFDERFNITTKAKIHIANQVYNDNKKSFINNNFDKYKDSVFKVIPEMIADCKIKELHNDMYLFEDYGIDANYRTDCEWNYLVLYNKIYEKLHNKKNIIGQIKKHYSSYISEINKAISDCEAYYKELKLDHLLENAENVETEGNNILYGKFYNGVKLSYNTEQKKFCCIEKSEKEPNFDEINLIEFDDYMKIIDKEFYKYRFVINKNIGSEITQETFNEIHVKIFDVFENFSYIKEIHIGKRYEKYNIDIIIPGIINGKQTFFADNAKVMICCKGDLIFRQTEGKKVKIFRRIYEQHAKGTGGYRNALFRYMPNITMIDLTGADTTDIKNMGDMFAQPYDTPHALLKEVRGLQVTSKVQSMNDMFKYCWNLTKIDMSNFDTSNVEDMNGMFYGCTQLQELDLKKLNTTKVTNMAKMFMHCFNLQNLNLSGFNTERVTRMHCMFYFCRSMHDLDLSSFNTSNVVNMGSMFSDMDNLKNLNIKSFDTSNVENMNSMFFNCKSLAYLNLENFNTGNVKYMHFMFDGCESLTHLNLDNFNTSNVTNMMGMFRDCKSLTHLNLSNFDTIHVRSMESMFAGCESLTYLDLSNFIITCEINEPLEYIYMPGMFEDCKSLTTIKWTAQYKLGSNAYKGCNSLIKNCMKNEDDKQ